jgi:hypothetical protein
MQSVRGFETFTAPRAPAKAPSTEVETSQPHQNAFNQDACAQRRHETGINFAEYAPVGSDVI